MTQQQQPPGAAQGMGMQQTGQQTGSQEMHTGQQQLVPQAGREFDEDLTSELRVALHDFEEVSRTTRWCVDKMIDAGPQMADCIRACQDIGELADVNVGMITRDSIYGLEAALLFAAVAEDGLQVIEQHQMPHCQETADAIRRALDSTWQLVETFGEPQLMHQLQQQLQQTQQRAQQQTQEMPPAVEQAQGMPPGQGGQQMGGQMQGGQQMGGHQTGQMQGGQQTGQMQGGQQTGGQMQGGQMHGGQPRNTQQY